VNKGFVNAAVMVITRFVRPVVSIVVNRIGY
jgi:hypothetical protein